MEMQVRSILSRLRSQLLAKLIIPKSKHAAVGVLNNEDGARAEKASGDDQRAQRIVGRQAPGVARSEEHTSELQSLAYLVCRLLLEKKKKQCVQPERYIHRCCTVK